MTRVTEIAEAAGRDYITPEDVIDAISQNRDDIPGIQRELLEVLAKQTGFGAEDPGLCCFVALASKTD